MPANPGARNATRVSRAVATARFIDAVIELLDTRPVAEISDQLIADTAGINRASIYRYFGTRLDLLDAVVADLTDRFVAMVDDVARAERGPDVNVNAFAIFATVAPTTRRIFTLGAYLSAANQRSESVRESFRTIIEAWERRLRIAGVAPRMATAIAYKVLALNFSRASLVGAVDVPADVLADVEALAVIEVANHGLTTEILGWGSEGG